LNSNLVGKLSKASIINNGAIFMANIAVSDLFATGHDLFKDDSSFLDELNTQEIQSIVGGGYSGYGYGHGHGHSHGYGHSYGYGNDGYSGGNWLF
jgi:hypothetical protein